MNAPHDETPGDAVPRDAWLRAALRHAPDADALPPADLSATILRQARAATARPAATSAGRAAGIASLWTWLGRPAVATGFASVMVAGVVGLMWWDRPIESSLPPRDAALKAPPAAPPPAPVAAVPAAPAPAAEPSAGAAPAAAAPTTPPTPRPAQAPQRRAVPDAVLAERAPTTGAATPSTAATAGPAPQAAATSEPLRQSTESVAGLPSAAPAPRAEAEVGAAPTADARLADAGDRPRAALAKAAPSAARATTPLAAPRNAIAMQPERWRWRRDGGEPRPPDAAFMAWLAALDDTSASRWQPAGTSPATAAGATRIELWLDGRLHTTLQLDADAVGVWSADAAAPQRAALPHAQATALRRALDDATR